MMSKSRYIFLLILISTAGGFFNVSFAQTAIATYQNKLDAIELLHKKITAQNTEIHALQKKLNNKGDEISALKNKKNSNFLHTIGLQKKMQEAQTLSVELDQLYTQKSKLTDQLAFHKKQLLRSVESDLSKAHLHERSYTQALMNFHARASKLEFKETLHRSTSMPATKITNTSTVEQWIVLKDLQLYTKELIDQTQQELSYEKQQKILKKELSHLMNEEMFFGEQGFIQGTARKQSNTTTVASRSDSPVEDTSEQDPTDPMADSPTEPVDNTPQEVDSVEPLEQADVDIENQDLVNPSIAFEEIDPKIQSAMMDSTFPEVALQDTTTTAANELQPEATTQNSFWENPNEVSHAISSLTPASGEPKEDFLRRKIAYLQEILIKLQDGSQKAKRHIESTVDEK